MEGVAEASIAPTEPHESLERVPVGAQVPLEAKQVIPAQATDPIEAIGAAQAALTGPHESIAQVNRAQTDPIESLEEIRQADTVAKEALGRAAAAGAVPYATGGTRQVPATPPYESEAKASLAATGPHESVAAVSKPLVTPQEALGRAAQSDPAPVEAAGKTSVAHQVPTEAEARAQAALGVTYEAGKTLGKTELIPWEGTGAARKAAGAPHEAAGRVEGPETTPYESIAEAAAVSNQETAPVEALASAAAGAQVPIESKAAELLLRERILRNLAATLNTITIANGYDHDIGEVVRLEQAGEELILHAIVVRERPVTNQDLSFSTSGLLEGLLRVELLLWVDVTDALTAAAEGNAFQMDVERAIALDPSRGGYAVDTELRGGDLEASNNPSIGFKTVVLDIEYQTERPDVRVGEGFAYSLLLPTAKANTISVKESALRNLVAALEAVQVANGYRHDVDQVERAAMHPVYLDSFPGALVVEGQEIKREGGPDAALNMITCDLDVEIIGVVKAWDDEAAHDSNLLLEDLVRAALLDPSRGGVAIATSIPSESQDSTKPALPYGSHRVSLRLRYRHAREDPSQPL